MYSHILVTTDGSDMAAKGVAHGLSLAAAVGAKVTVLTVTPTYPIVAGVMGEAAYMPASVLQDYDAAQQEHADRVLRAAVPEGSGVTVDRLHIPNAPAAEAIIRAAQELGCDLICMASHGRRGLSRMLLGSQASEVLGHSTVPVLIIR